jgi:hypothetical protein
MQSAENWTQRKRYALQPVRDRPASTQESKTVINHHFDTTAALTQMPFAGHHYPEITIKQCENVPCHAFAWCDPKSEATKQSTVLAAPTLD